MPKENQVSLYQCFNARVGHGRIYCAKGHRLGLACDGMLDVERLAWGAPLEFKICQDCPDFSGMGDAIPAEERGWVKRIPHRSTHKNP